MPQAAPEKLGAQWLELGAHALKTTLRGKTLQCRTRLVMVMLTVVCHVLFWAGQATQACLHWVGQQDFRPPSLVPSTKGMARSEHQISPLVALYFLGDVILNDHCLISFSGTPEAKEEQQVTSWERWTPERIRMGQKLGNHTSEAQIIIPSQSSWSFGHWGCYSATVRANVNYLSKRGSGANISVNLISRLTFSLFSLNVVFQISSLRTSPIKFGGVSSTAKPAVHMQYRRGCMSRHRWQKWCQASQLSPTLIQILPPVPGLPQGWTSPVAGAVRDDVKALYKWMNVEAQKL